MKPPGLGKKIAKIKASKAKAAKAEATEARAAGYDVANKADSDTVKVSDPESGWVQSTLRDIKAFRDKLDKVKWKADGIFEDDWRAFALLLSVPSSSQSAPGFPRGMGYDKLYGCASERDRHLLQCWFEDMEVRDEISLMKLLDQNYDNHIDFLDFRAFWAGGLGFDIYDQGEERWMVDGRMAVVEKLAELGGNLGFLAFDLCEGISFIRCAHALGIIPSKRVWQLLEFLAAKVAAHFDNWGQYALSCLCGFVYHTYSKSLHDGISEAHASVLKLGYLNALRKLTAQGGVWRMASWPRRPMLEKKPGSGIRDLLPLIPRWAGQILCLASDRIMVDGAKVGYMYREDAAFDGDSGWRFFAGDESEDYRLDPKTSVAYSLNGICNRDPDIMGFLFMKTRRALRRIDGGQLRPVDS
ncbi:MAG: DUF2185 domain-containing protein [Deltaproteobacteria bacterium]|jgi:hypothetical protein|nr:DUF2185 domain-containing protein [Deltaproteobacteria bacterium]